MKIKVTTTYDGFGVEREVRTGERHKITLNSLVELTKKYSDFPEQHFCAGDIFHNMPREGRGVPRDVNWNLQPYVCAGFAHRIRLGMYSRKIYAYRANLDKLAEIKAEIKS